MWKERSTLAGSNSNRYFSPSDGGSFSDALADYWLVKLIKIARGRVIGRFGGMTLAFWGAGRNQDLATDLAVDAIMDCLKGHPEAVRLASAPFTDSRQYDLDDFKPYLVQRVAGRGINDSRRRLRRQKRLQQWLSTVGARYDETLDPGQGAAIAERRRKVWDALAKLSEADCKILILHYMEYFTYREISVYLEIELTKVKSRLHRALVRLAEKVREDY
jgi:RNA polymerase sigma factor (sigma-70 family)